MQRHAFNNAQTSMRSLGCSTLVASSQIWPPMFDVVVVLAARVPWPDLPADRQSRIQRCLLEHNRETNFIVASSRFRAVAHNLQC